MAFNAEHIKWFRDSSPYIDAHRGRTFVISLASEALDSQNIGNIISDVALLNSLGVRIVLTYSADAQVKAALSAAGIECPSHNGQLIITPQAMPVATGAVGAVTADLCARLSSSAPDSPAERREISAVSGNFLKAKPIGIVDGLDHQHTGAVRKVNARAIHHLLDANAIVLVPAMGFSPSGEIFLLDPLTSARETACSLSADKLIFLSSVPGLSNAEGNLISEIDLSDTSRAELAADSPGIALLEHCNSACNRGVARCHIISYGTDGAMLEELFTRDGCGTQVIGHSYEQIRPASLDDVPGILKLIEPLEASGALVKRSRELLESEIDHFTVIERDGLLISCAALYLYGDHGELACVVTHPDYRKGDRGDRLLEVIEKKARQLGLTHLFVLTTQSAHWFSERGFAHAGIESLPETRQAYYNYQRNSRVLSKAL